VSTFEKLRIFYHVAKEGSIKRACTTLNTTEPRISRHLSDLEQELQQKLFIRRKTGLQLTHYGSTLYANVHSSIANIEQVLQQFNTDTPQTKSLKIITTTGVISIILARAAAKFLKEYQDVDIKIYTTNEDVDFATFTGDIGILPRIQNQPGLNQRKLITLHSRLFASPGYIQQYGMPQTIQDLDHHQLIGFYPDLPGNRGNADWHLSKDTSSSTYRRARLAINSVIGLYEAAREDLGILAIPQEFPFIKEGGWVSVLPQEDSVNFDVYFIVRAGELTSQLVETFYEYLKDYLNRECLNNDPQ
jgi:DNA-binding transcriptional LysR family regulator